MRAPSLFDAPDPTPERTVQFTRPVAATGRIERLGEGMVFAHPCGRCGAPVAPFGFDVSLIRALTERRADLAGRWLCGPCWRAEGQP